MRLALVFPTAPVLACIGREQTVRRRIWRILAPLASLSALPALVFTPSRPLVPPAILFEAAARAGINPARVERLSRRIADRIDELMTPLRCSRPSRDASWRRLAILLLQTLSIVIGSAPQRLKIELVRVPPLDV